MQYLNLFDKDYIDRSPVTGVVVARDADYIKRLYTFNKDAIESYYMSRNFSVKNTNILSRILEHFPVYLNGDVYDYLSSVENRLTYLAKHFKFTSDLEKGVLHPPYFFGNDCDELIFSGYERFDAIDYSKRWKTSSCIRVLTHARADQKFLLPLGVDDGSRSGLSAVFIDMAKLAIKYREFNKEQLSRRDDEVQLNKNHFVIKYVLSTSMDSIVDHTLLNSIMDRFYGTEAVVPKRKHPFKIFEPTTQLTRYIDDTLDVITSKPMDFVTLLKHIKLVFSDDASGLLALPDMYGSRQMLLPIVTTRLKYMVFLLDASKNLDMNRKFVNDWKTLATRLLRDVSASGMFHYELEKDIKEKLERLSKS